MYRGGKYGDDLLRFRSRFNDVTKVSDYGLFYKNIPLAALTNHLGVGSGQVDVAANIKRDAA